MKQDIIRVSQMT